MTHEPIYRPARQTGRTQAQLAQAPRGATYIWPNSVLSYPIRMAAKLGRTDLVFKPRSWLSDRYVRGLRLPAVVLDHAVERLTPEERYALEIVHASGSEVL
jgi:hypothetical protein